MRTRETLCQPEVSQLILRGARECGFPNSGAVLAEIAARVESSHLGLFVAFDGREPCAVALGQLPESALALAATVHLAYSKPRKVRMIDLISAKMRLWFTSNGVDKVLVLNLLHTDRAYIRGLAHFGTGSRIGSVIEFAF